MKQKIVVVDFSGTLIKANVAEEANLKRYRILGISAPSEQEHKKLHGTKGHYDVLKNHIEKQFDIKDDMQIAQVQNYGKEVLLSGKDVKTTIMTDLFRIAMYEVAAEKKQKIFAEGMIDVLQTIKSRGYLLAIVSGIRTDIISGMLAISGCPIKFDFIYGQDSVLSREDNQMLDDLLSKQGKIEYLIGDKLSDLTPKEKLKCKAIFAKWGHPTGGEEEFADFSIQKPEELERIIK